MPDHNVDWETCADDGCIGVRLPTSTKCWAHAVDTELELAFKRLGEHGLLDARGVLIIQELLRRLLAAAPQDDQGHAILTDARFDEATFQDAARFDRTTFRRGAWFGGATFQDAARFDMTTFQHGAWFDRATFRDDAGFYGATFQGGAGFRGATIHGDVRFGGATFQRARQLGPMLVRKSLRLDQAVFHERAQIEVAAAAVCCQRTRFLAGVQLRVRWAQVVLDDADLAAPSILTGVPRFPDLNEGRWEQAMERLLPRRRGRRGRWRWQPRLLSLRRADVAGLTVGLVDMRACQFADAHNLDKLRLETLGAFGDTPSGWRWTARQALAEEHRWRHLRAASRHGPERASGDAAGSQPHGRHHRTWFPAACQPPSWVDARPLAPVQIAALYRALRKGREDNRDEPGAADFYYGEMEMRRFAQREDAVAARRRRRYGPWAAASTERAVLWLYWLTSGYGLRAWRALATLAIVVLLAGGVFALWGFDPPGGLDELPDAIRFSAQAAAALLRGPDRPLTPLGEWLHLGVRLVGPVLLGLTVLSVRGRVKR